MAMPHAAHDWSVERILALPDDGNRREVVDGELLVTPSPSLHHQDAVLALILGLQSYFRGSSVGRLGMAPADLELDGRTLVQPDLFVYALPAGRRPAQWSEVRDLLLVIEVLSPSTARADRQLKRRRYQRHGIPEYWVVDLDARLIERWRPGDERPELLDDSVSWHPDPTAPELTIDLPAFFAEVLDR